MSETYKFYVQMDGEVFGPYSARAVRDLNLLEDILVTEESMNGEWLPAGRFDFDDMVRKESGAATASPQYAAASTMSQINNQAGSNVFQSAGGANPYQPTTADSQDDDSPIGWCILALIIPLVGFILYFTWKNTYPKKAAAICTWAWIGLITDIITMIFSFA